MPIATRALAALAAAAALADAMRLEVGDIFQTGVPAPVVPLKAGDTVEIAIEGLGTPLRNRVVANGATAGVR